MSHDSTHSPSPPEPNAATDGYNGLRVTAKLTFESSGKKGCRLSFKTRDGGSGTQDINYGMLTRPTELIEKLADNDFRAPLDAKGKNDLIHYIDQASPDKAINLCDSMGWRVKRFVWSGKTFGQKKGDNPKYLLDRANADAMAKFSCAGSLSDWQEQIAAPCMGNPIHLFSLSVAFSSSLLDIIHAEATIFNLFSRGRGGKTSLIRAAGSVCGGTGHKDGYIVSVDGSIKGLEAVAMAHDNMLLALDELSTADKDAKRQMTHKIADGKGSNRSKTDGTLRGGKRTYQCNALMTANESSKAYELTAVGEETQDAQMARCIDILASGGEGKSLVTRVPKEIGGTPIKGAPAFSDHLTQASTKYYGTPIVAFLKKLAKARREGEEGLREEIDGHVQAFISEVGVDGGQGIPYNIAQRFGLVYAAGVMAIKYEVLPWPKEEVMDAVLYCHNAHWQWRHGSELRQKAEEKATEAEILGKVAAYIRDHRIRMIHRLSLKDLEGQEFDRLIGFHDQARDGSVRYWIKPTMMETVICKGFSSDDLVRVFKAQQWLIKDKGSPRRQPPETEGLKRRDRYYCLKGVCVDSWKE